MHVRKLLINELFSSAFFGIKGVFKYLVQLSSFLSESTTASFKALRITVLFCSSNLFIISSGYILFYFGQMELSFHKPCLPAGRNETFAIADNSMID